MSRFGWMDRAACVGHDPEIWFDGARRELAVRICAGCPVQAECRAAGQGAYRGVWAGQVHNPKNPGPSPTAVFIGYEHGTLKGYKRHMSEGTRPCGQCQTANTFHWHDRQKRHPQKRKACAS